MDDSWRCTMGTVLPRQRSSSSSGHHASGGGSRQSLAPDDFRDVFGGPPRTVLFRSFYGEADGCHSPSTGQQYHYPSYGGADAAGFCRRPYPYVEGRGHVPAAAVPTEDGFFDDIFGARHVRSRSRTTSKSTKSSSDEFGSAAFCRTTASGGRGDATLSSFASKLRPIAIPSRRYDDSSAASTVSTRGEYQSSFTCSTAAYPTSRCYRGGRTTNYHRSAASSNAGAGEHQPHHRNHRAGGGFCCFTSNPETASNGHSFRRTSRAAARARSSPADGADADTVTTESSRVDYGYYYSPPSAASSSLFGNPAPRTPRGMEEVMMEVRERAPLLMDDDGDIDSVGAAAVDEAIAWAKERFWSQA